MSLIWPDAKVIALDAGVEGKNNQEGIDLTNRIAEENSLNAKVVFGFSPDDVASVIKNNFEQAPDIVFIDGLHTDEQISLDFQACYRVCGHQSIYVFHDIMNFNLSESFSCFSQNTQGMSWQILGKTTSGMGMGYPTSFESNLKRLIDVYSVKEKMVKSLRSKKILFLLFEMLPVSLKNFIAYLPSRLGFKLGR